MDPRISMVSLAVSDLDRAVAFYEGGLGLPRLPGPPGVAFFNLSGTWLGLAPYESVAAEIGAGPDAQSFGGINLAHNVSTDKAVDDVIAQAEAAGATVVKAPTRADWGGYHGYFRDPDGHHWEIAHNPFLWIGPPEDAP